MSLFENIFGSGWAATVEPYAQRNYANQITNNQTNLQNAHIDWQQQAAAAHSFSHNADAYRYAQKAQQMHQTVNLNQSMIDLLKTASSRKMLACAYCTTEEERVWAILQDYEQSLTDPELYIKWGK